MTAPIMASSAEASIARLTVDLDAIERNFAFARRRFEGRTLGAALKADAYGLGLEPVARRLARAGCDTYWVADPVEALRLRRLLPEARIFVLHGLSGLPPSSFRADRLLPVLASLQDVRACMADDQEMEVAIQLDCGLTRLGLLDEEAATVAAEPAFRRLKVAALITQLIHFAEPGSIANLRQLERFQRLAARLGPAPLSIATSACLELDRRFHLDIARIGGTLFGLQAATDGHQPIEVAYRVSAPVLRVATVRAGVGVGYGETYRTDGTERIATIGAGYADGVPSGVPGRGFVIAAGHAAPFVGRVSMTLSAVSLAALGPDRISPGDEVELVGPALPVEALGRLVGASGASILTGFGRSVSRRYEPLPGNI
jgi:alanine racemase